jgi:hypothetical protein
MIQPPRGTGDTGQDPALPPGRLDPLADRHPPIVPAAFRKLDTVAVLTGPSLPVPRLFSHRTEDRKVWFRLCHLRAPHSRNSRTR